MPSGIDQSHMRARTCLRTFIGREGPLKTDREPEKEGLNG
jgi:hypothetical protein